MPYQITEPHPTALPNHYVHCGRGGAGNLYKVSSSSDKKSPSLTKTASNTSSIIRPSSSKTSTGRGGAGNIHPVSDLPMFSFDEEMNFQVGREKAHDVWHVGRGGAGNWSKKESQESQRKNSNESVASDASSRSGFLGRLSGAFDRH